MCFPWLFLSAGTTAPHADEVVSAISLRGHPLTVGYGTVVCGLAVNAGLWPRAVAPAPGGLTGVGQAHLPPGACHGVLVGGVLVVVVLIVPVSV